MSSGEYDDGKEHYKKGGSIYDDLTWDERRGFIDERDYWENINKPNPTSSLPTVFDSGSTFSSYGSSSSDVSGGFWFFFFALLFF